MHTDADDQRNIHLMSVRQVADRLGCSQANVYGLINRGLLPVICVGRSKGYRVAPNDLEAFVQQRKVRFETAEPAAPRPHLKHIRL